MPSSNVSVMPQVVSIVGQHFSPESTGNAPYTTSLSRSLARRGHEVTVHTTYPFYPEWSKPSRGNRWTQRSVDRGVTLIRRKQYVPSRPSSLCRLLSELSFGARILTGRIGRSDVVLLVSPSLFGSALALVRIRLNTRRPKVGIWVQDLYSQGVVEIGVGGRLTAKLMTRIESWVLGHADGVAVIHERFARRIVQSLGVERRRVTVIRNWSHLPLPRPIDRHVERRILGWQDDEIVVLHAGNQGAKQGLDQLIPIAERIQELDLPIKIVLLGTGNQRMILQSELDRYECVQFIDPLPDTEFQAAMCAADLLLVCEKSGVTEMSVPSKLTSYFSTGRPVIAITDPGSATAEEISASRTGEQVASGQPAEFIAKVLALGSDAERSSEMGAAGLVYRTTVLDEAAAVDAFEQWFESL